MIKTALLISAFTAPFAHAATPSIRGAIAIDESSNSAMEGGCQDQGLHPPIFHFTNEDRDVIRQYKKSHDWLLNDLSAHKANGKYGVQLKDESVYQYVAEGDFVFWGVKHGHSVASAWNGSTSVEEFFQVLGVGSHSWHYDARAPFYLSENETGDRDDTHTIKNTTVLDDGSNYVAFPSFFQDANQDLVLMDYLGYVGFLRSALPPSVKLLLVTNNKHQHKEILEHLDPEFAAKRVHWIECGDELEQCNQHVKIRNGGNLELFKPPFVSKSDELLGLAKRLIQWRYKKQNSSSNNNNIVYLRDTNLPVQIEKVLLAQVQRHLQAFGRPETLVTYEDGNGYQSFLRKLQLLQEAKIVIGVTGELMNALPFIKANDSLSCDDRMKLLEIVTPPDDSPQLSWSSSRHLLLTTYPNVELHNVLLDIDDEDAAKARHDISLQGTSVQLALQSMLHDGKPGLPDAAAAITNAN